MSAAPSSFGTKLVLIGVLGLLGCTLAGYVGSLHWVLDLFVHFRVQYAVLLILCFAWLIFTRHRLVALLAIGGAMLNAGAVLPLFTTAPAPPPPEAARLNVVGFNANGFNERIDEIVSFVASSQADVIVLLEVRPALSEALEALEDDYEIALNPRQDRFGSAVLSRHEIIDWSTVHLGDSEFPAIEAYLEWGEVPVAVLGVHTPPPISTAFATMRDAQLQGISEWRGLTLGTPAVVIGDFNTTPWSHRFRSLLGASRLIDSAPGFGLQVSWHRALVPLRIPIDHALHTRDLVTVDRHLGPWLGSDHRPLHVTLALAEPVPEDGPEPPEPPELDEGSESFSAPITPVNIETR